VSSSNTTTTPLGASATYTGTGENVLPYVQVNVALFVRPNTAVSGDGTNAKGSFFFEFSPDNTNWDISVPVVVRSPGLLIPFPLITVGKFFRVRYVNDGGAAAITALGLTETAGTPTAQTAFRLTSYLLTFPTKEIARTLDQQISGSDPVAVVRSVTTGLTPDQLFTNARQTGISTANTTTATLGGGGVFLGTFTECLGFASINLVISSNVASATNGVQIEYSSDGVTVGLIQNFEYTGAIVGAGEVYVLTPPLRWFRIRYTNGGSAQASFLLVTTFEAQAAGIPQASFIGPLSDTTLAALTRGLVIAPNAGGTYGNVQRGTSGGLDTGIVQFEVEAPIKSLITGSSSSLLISGTALQIANPALTNRRSISIKNAPTNGANDVLYIGFSSGVSTTTGYPLGRGDSMDMEIDDTVPIYAIASTSNVRCFWVEVAA